MGKLNWNAFEEFGSAKSEFRSSNEVIKSQISCSNGMSLQDTAC